MTAARSAEDVLKDLAASSETLADLAEALETAKSRRNTLVVEAVASGATIPVIADTAGISNVRIYQIRAQNPTTAKRTA